MNTNTVVADAAARSVQHWKSAKTALAGRKECVGIARAHRVHDNEMDQLVSGLAINVLAREGYGSDSRQRPAVHTVGSEIA
jgi:hypothetical protein